MPVINRTVAKRADWESYYGPTIVEQAKRVCGPFMEKWGYRFPTGWGDTHVPWSAQLDFRLAVRLRNMYHHHFRYNNRLYARLVRRAKARLIG